MCGRFTNTLTGPELGAYFDVDELSDYSLPPAWNIRPTDPIAVVIDTARDDEGRRRRLEAARWSLVPSFSPELKLKYPTFNARSEGVAGKSAFKASVVSKRALVPAGGYFEWLTEGKTKTPFYISSPEGPLAFAGLYSWWRDRSKGDDDPARWVLTATILTRDAVGPLAEIHDRTPVALPRHLWDVWLDPSVAGSQPFVDDAVAASSPVIESLSFHRVGPVTGDGPETINPL